MRRRYLWALVTACLVSFVPTEHATCAEHTVVVGTINSEGIDQLIKTSQGTVIVAMAAWCLPCREELPTLANLYEKYKDRGLKMVGISLDSEGPSAIQPVVDKANVRFPVYWAGEKAADDFNIRAMPLLLFVKNGSIVERVLGKRHETFLDQKINDLLKEAKITSQEVVNGNGKHIPRAD